MPDSTPERCRQTDTDSETGCKEFEIAKGRFSFRLTAPYSEKQKLGVELPDEAK